jgi:hypothetical protein
MKRRNPDDRSTKLAKLLLDDIELAAGGCSKDLSGANAAPEDGGGTIGTGH